MPTPLRSALFVSVCLICASACASKSSSAAKQPRTDYCGGDADPRENTVLANASFAPDPWPELLAQTESARYGESGCGVVAFCVSKSGKVVDVEMEVPFMEDPSVDEVLMYTVRNWRFKPFINDGTPTKTCSQVRFSVAFVGSEPVGWAQGGLRSTDQ